MSRILIVEDNPVEAREISYFVRAAGFQPDVAADAEQGFAALRSGNYDLLLADLHLPGENGFRLCRRIKSDEHLSRLPVVLLTRFADPLNVLHGLEAGADGFISKGQQPSEIIERLTRILNRRAAVSESQPPSSDRVVFLQTEFELDASRTQLLEVLLSGFEDAVCLNQKYEKEVAAHARAQKSIRDLTVLYQSLVETLPLGILRKELDGKYTFANTPFCEQLKMQPGEIVGKTDRELFPGDQAEQYCRDDEEVLRSGNVLDRVQACTTATGESRFVHVRRVPLRNAKHELIGIQAIVSDVTEMKRTEQQLVTLNHSLEERVAQRTQELAQRNEQLEQKNAELDQYAYIASHDLQEPLRKVISFSQLLEQDVGAELNDAARKDLYYIVEAAQRMRKLVQDLLAYSRAGRAAMNWETVPLDECVDRALDAIAIRIDETKAEIARDPLPEVHGDRTLLTQLYQNLICNAIKFVRDRQPRIRLTAERNGDCLTLGVVDNGIGIAPEYRQQIFGPFQRLHSRSEFEGTGVGLAICQTTVERHGGVIWVESEPGIGSHFKFTLKALVPAPAGHGITTLPVELVPNATVSYVS